MPEGDTVHKLATAIAPLLVGERLDEVRARGRPLTSLRGCRVAAVHALGKHLYIELDNGQSLRSHLGMHGAWHGYAPGETWHKPPRRARLVLATGRRVLVCFDAKEVELLETSGARARAQRTRLGPDLLSPGFHPSAVAARAATLLAADEPLVDLLLDQRVASGIGNVYKSELLFLQGLHPLAAWTTLSAPAVTALYALAASLLARNLGGGRRRTRFTTTGPRLWVYGRGGRPCLRCGGTVTRAPLGRDLRGTWWCARCQPALSRAP